MASAGGVAGLAGATGAALAAWGAVNTGGRLGSTSPTCVISAAAGLTWASALAATWEANCAGSKGIAAARGLHGQLVPDRLGWTILLNESDHPRVQRLSLFHEAFHILRRSRGLFGDEDYRYLEWLANAFAYRVLIPRDWLASALKPTADSRRLAATFFVPLPVMKERLKEMGR